MILELEHWYLGYADIIKSCREQQGSALLLCHVDADAMASARILSFMLRSDGIPYQLRPCNSYMVLEETLTKSDANYSVIILLNMGATRNLVKLLSSSSTTKLFVMDCRRPVHLSNIYAGDNVVIFWDQTQSDDLPSDGDNLSGNEDSSDEEDESSDDDDDDDDGNSELDNNDNDSDNDEVEANFDDVIEGDKPQLSSNDLNGNDDHSIDYDGEDENDNNNNNIDDDENDDDTSIGKSNHAHSPTTNNVERDDHDSRPTKRQKAIDDGDIIHDDDGLTDLEHDDDGQTDNIHEDENINNVDIVSSTPRDLHRLRRDRLRSYYSSGTFYGSPASYVAYRLASQLRFGDQGDLLWLACVGVTDAYLHARLDVAGYTTLALDLRRSCLRMFPDDTYSRVQGTVYAEELFKTNNNNNNNDNTLSTGQNDAARQKTKIGFSENGRILAGKDYRFFLLRHSSLLDSMVHSDYVSTKLQVWTKSGMHQLREFLAKMGYPLDECRQPFAFMRPTLRRKLNDQIKLHAEEYGLENFEFTSFFRVTGHQSLLSASDTSYAITALLECEFDLSHDSKKSMLESFHKAYDALNTNASVSNVSSLVNGGGLSGQTGIGAGLRLAMSLQRNIVSTAVSLVNRNAITRLRHFRYAYLGQAQPSSHNASFPTLDKKHQQQSLDSDCHNDKHSVFGNPLALCRLAHYLMDMHRENGKWAGNRARPLVLMAERLQSQTFLVAGYEYPELAGHFVKNRFGMNFELTAKSMMHGDSAIRFDSFDSNVVEVNSTDVQRFIEQLHYLMDSI